MEATDSPLKIKLLCDKYILNTQIYSMYSYTYLLNTLNLYLYLFIAQYNGLSLFYCCAPVMLHCRGGKDEHERGNIFS